MHGEQSIMFLHKANMFILWHISVSLDVYNWTLIKPQSPLFHTGVNQDVLSCTARVVIFETKPYDRKAAFSFLAGNHRYFLTEMITVDSTVYQA